MEYSAAIEFHNLNTYLLICKNSSDTIREKYQWHNLFLLKWKRNMGTIYIDLQVLHIHYSFASW